MTIDDRILATLAAAGWLTVGQLHARLPQYSRGGIRATASRLAQQERLLRHGLRPSFYATPGCTLPPPDVPKPAQQPQRASLVPARHPAAEARIAQGGPALTVAMEALALVSAGSTT